MAFMTGLAGCAKDTAKQAKATAPSKPEKKKVSLEELTALQEAGPQKYVFDPACLRDPFIPIDAVKSAKAPGQEVAEQEKRLTPLQKFDLSQFKLVAVVMAGDNTRALVEDSGGMGYIIQPGTPIGMRGGHVLSILKDKILVEEYTVNYLGEKKSKTSELKLHPIGEGEEQ